MYAISRLSRVYSVALPAVAFSVTLAILALQRGDFDLRLLSNFSVPTLWSVVSSLLFLNVSWMNEVDLTLNNPYWSLCYEVWFYILFGAYFYTQGRRRFWFLMCAALLAGPAILLLLPIWLFGAFLAASGRYNTRWNVLMAWLGFLVPILLIGLIKNFSLDSSVRLILYENIPGYWRLFSSQRFLTDYFIGIMVCLNIASFSSLPSFFQDQFSRFRGTLTSLAGFSFTLYLFHRPMTQLAGAYMPIGKDAIFRSALCALAILVICYALSWITEKRLNDWRRWFSRLFTHVSAAHNDK